MTVIFPSHRDSASIRSASRPPGDTLTRDDYEKTIRVVTPIGQATLTNAEEPGSTVSDFTASGGEGQRILDHSVLLQAEEFIPFTPHPPGSAHLGI